MMKRYSHHTFSVQSPHTMDAILFRDVKKRNCGYRPYRGKWKTRTRGFRRRHGIPDFKVKSYHVMFQMDGGEGSHGTSDTEYSGTERPPPAKKYVSTKPYL